MNIAGAKLGVADNPLTVVAPPNVGATDAGANPDEGPGAGEDPGAGGGGGGGGGVGGGGGGSFLT